MGLNFEAALAFLRANSGPNFATDLANGARPRAAYVFTNTVLPIQEVPSYTVQASGILVRSTMAGLVGMDSEPGPGGAMELDTFLANVAKFGIKNRFTEAAIRQMQTIAAQIALGGGDSTQFAVENVLNFIDKLLIQPQFDTLEYLAVRACMEGELNWTFNQKDLTVDYGVPAGNLFAQRTGTDHYGGTTSKFWTDWRAARSILGAAPIYAFATRDTIDMIISNENNNIFLTNQDEFGSASFDRIVNTTIDRRSEDVRNQGSLIAYDQSGNILDLANVGQTVEVPFLSDGYIILIGRARRNQFGLISNRGDEEPPAGSTRVTPRRGASIGYTHMGPTVENGGRTGIWNRVQVPNDMPMQLEGLSYMNAMPFILEPDRLVVLRTAMS